MSPSYTCAWKPSPCIYLTSKYSLTPSRPLRSSSRILSIIQLSCDCHVTTNHSQLTNFMMICPKTKYQLIEVIDLVADTYIYSLLTNPNMPVNHDEYQIVKYSYFYFYLAFQRKFPICIWQWYPKTNLWPKYTVDFINYNNIQSNFVTKIRRKTSTVIFNSWVSLHHLCHTK
jgi:hypothetical protein